MQSGKCQGCDDYGMVDDMSLCYDCGSEIDEDKGDGHLEIFKVEMEKIGYEVNYLDDNSLRCFYKGKKVMDVWAPRNKNGNFKGYTIHKWDDDKYYKRMFDLEDFVNRHK